MHIGAKKEEFRRIELENIKIAKKIYMIEPLFKAKAVDDKFKHLQYVSSNMTKIKREALPEIAEKKHLIKFTSRQSLVSARSASVDQKLKSRRKMKKEKERKIKGGLNFLEAPLDDAVDRISNTEES